MTVEQVAPELAARVQGGIPGSETNGMWADVLVEVDAEGNRIWEWRADEHLSPERHIVTWNDRRDEWSHGNTIMPIGDDRVMFSFRNISTVGIIDKASGAIVWELGYETLAQQHDPNLLPNGNVLIYDNGSHRSDAGLPFSRIIEVNPANNEIVWEYADNPAYNFFSSYISGARRLPNGNTLITEGTVRADVPGNAGMRGGLGVHQPPFPRGFRGPAGQPRLPGNALSEGRYTLADLATYQV